MKKDEDKMAAKTVREIDCDEVMRQLFDYLDDEVDITAGGEIHHHIEECRSCFTRVEFERQIKSRVRGAGKKSAPESLRNKITDLMKDFSIDLQDEPKSDKDQ